MTMIALLLALLPAQFIEEYYPYAKQVEECTGLSASAVLTVAAIETGWGKRATNNNFFGIKGTKENGALIRTIEYHPSTCVWYPKIESITLKGKLYRYVVWAYFRVYDTPMDSFCGYAAVVEKYFPSAWLLRCVPKKYFKEIAGKYATSPNAYALSIKVLKIVNREIYEYELHKSQEICD